MYQLLERRHLDRFIIPDAKVSYTASNGSSIVVPLTDISKSSVRFEMTTKMEAGNFIELELIVPSQEKILIKGHIIWTSNDNHNLEKNVYSVVQFLPFGSDEQYNSTKSQAQLRELFKIYNNISENAEN